MHVAAHGAPSSPTARSCSFARRDERVMEPENIVDAHRIPAKDTAAVHRPWIRGETGDRVRPIECTVTAIVVPRAGPVGAAAAVLVVALERERKHPRRPRDQRSPRVVLGPLPQRLAILA